MIPVRPNYSSGEIFSGSFTGSLPRSSGGTAGTVPHVGSAPNLVRVGDMNKGYGDGSPDSGRQTWNNGWQVGNESFSVSEVYVTKLL